jgi:hypothetical protein
MQQIYYSGTANTILEIDHIGRRYGLLRGDNESLEDFKKRILSYLMYPISLSELGVSSSISRELFCSPEAIGYLKITNLDYFVAYDGVNLTVKNAQEDLIFSINAFDRNTIYEINEYFMANNIGEVYISDAKWLAKEIAFIKPFTNYEARKEINAYAGLVDLPDLHIIPNSFNSSSPYFQNKVNLPELVLAKGDYYFDGTNRLNIYNDGTLFSSIRISYAKKWEYIPLVYSPVSVKSLSSLVNDRPANLSGTEHNLVNSNENIYTEINKDYLDLFWQCLQADNKVWKGNQVSPISMNGTYYGKSTK